MISVDTKLISLLGEPLRQSFSTKMQNDAFRERGLDFEYFPIEVGKEHLSDIVRAIRHMNYAGFALTKPNKVAIIPLLDELDPLAEKIGAVNTVVIVNGKLTGHNTDGEGCVRSIEQNIDKPVSQTGFFCFGAGGSARAVCYTLAARGAKRIYITSLHDKNALSLSEEINCKYGRITEAVQNKDEAKIVSAVSDSQVVMNHSGVGMAPGVDDTPVSEEALHAGQLVFDATYNPAKTRFLKDAEKRGAGILNGLGMLVHQGAIQFKLWTGRNAPLESMFRTANEMLGERR